MERVETELEGPILLAPAVHADARGFFAETFRADLWLDAGVTESFVQDNHSRSRRGTLRGMHFAVDPGQAKLIRCARGEIFDVVLDLLRPRARGRNRLRRSGCGHPVAAGHRAHPL